jgi:hypothetical protein
MSDHVPPPEDVSDADWQEMCVRAQAGLDLADAVALALGREMTGDDFNKRIEFALAVYRKAVDDA